MDIYNESQKYINIRYKYEDDDTLSENWKRFNDIYWNSCETVEDGKLLCKCGSLIKHRSKIGHIDTNKHYQYVKSMMERSFRKQLKEIRSYIYTDQYFKDEQKKQQENTPVVNLPQFLVDEYKTYLKLSDDVIECPICYEDMRDSLNILSCGHKTCKECIQKCDKCPICRRKYFKV